MWVDSTRSRTASLCPQGHGLGAGEKNERWRRTNCYCVKMRYCFCSALQEVIIYINFGARKSKHEYKPQSACHFSMVTFHSTTAPCCVSPALPTTSHKHSDRIILGQSSGPNVALSRDSGVAEEAMLRQLIGGHMFGFRIATSELLSLLSFFRVLAAHAAERKSGTRVL